MSSETQLSLSEAVLFGVERQWRLARVELANWGTFCGFHRLEVDRRGLLITGPSGSGKSTLLDAITTVLTPPQSLLDFQPYVVNGIDPRKLRQDYPDCKAVKNHAQFSAHFRQLMGIRSAKTLELLHKTQVAKNFGSLDDLFRNFMLDEPETFKLASDAVEQFTELDTAHKNVVDQRDQMWCLEPLLAINDDVARLEEARQENQLLQVSLNPCADRLVVELQTRKLERLDRRLDQLGDALARAEAERDMARVEASQAQSVVDKQGGIAIDDAEKEVYVKTRQLKDVENNRKGLADLTSLSLDELPTTLAAWRQFKRDIEAQAAKATQYELDHRDENRRAQGLPGFLQDRIDEIDRELRHLRSRKSNIPRADDDLRTSIARHIGITADNLPYMGELLSVKPEFEHWQGALERLIGQKSLTLLVPEHLAKPVALYDDERHIGMRFEFVSVPREVIVPDRTLRARSVARRLQVRQLKSHPEFSLWVNRELRVKWDYECVDSAAELDRYERALTINGQIKQGWRYIKDDRHELHDQRRWYMRVNNESKVEGYEDEKAALEQQLGEADRAASLIEQAMKDTENLNRAVASLHERPWENYDIKGLRHELKEAKQQLIRLKKGNKNLDEAIANRDKARQKLEAADAELTKHIVALQEAENQRASVLKSLEEVSEKLSLYFAEHPAVEAAHFDTLRQAFQDADAAYDRSSESIYRTSNLVRGKLSRAFQGLGDQVNRAKNKGQLIMRAHKTQWPSLAANLTSNYEDIDGYLGIYRQIKATGLPNHESQFLKILRDFSQDQITLLASTIRNAPSEIQAKLDPVNASLSLSDYAEGTHLRIEMGNSRGRVAVEFLGELNAISSGSLSADNMEEAEPRFERAASIIRRLGSGEAVDVRWRRQCLDTRLHVKFIANEIDASQRVVSAYESDTGLSGGQKQKLVVFCLAAALRYQLAEEGRELPRYGTVILDEAFDKADFHFASSALDIFEAFGFHMVLATPLRHLQTIERHVGGIVAVNCFEGQRSELYPIPFEELSSESETE